MTPSTEISLTDGGRYQVQGDVKAVERSVLDAARGAIMEFAWFTEVASGEQLAINPDSVVMIRAVNS